MHINNELGTINDLESIGKIARKKGIFFHVDAAQTPGKVPLDLSTLPVDLMFILSTQNIWPEGSRSTFCPKKTTCKN